tara:strand:+ start:10836 stop:11096 length:261 start_codon:yes stop_codon:yes gene_type:complete
MMRYPTINPLVAVCCLPVITACSNFMDALEMVKDPAIQEALAQTATGAATGNWLGALWGAGALVAAVAGHKTVKAVKKKKAATATA